MVLVFYLLAEVLKEDVPELCSLDFFFLNSKFHCFLIVVKDLCISQATAAQCYSATCTEERINAFGLTAPK